MKYSEFKTEVEKMGFSVKFMKNNVYVEHNCEILGNVDLHARYMLATQHNAFFRLDETISFKLYELCMMLAETPLAEREEEKRYYLRFANKLITCSDDYYLNLIKRSKGDYYYLDNDREDFGAKTIFTESEISQMDITGFQKIEVEE